MRHFAHRTYVRTRDRKACAQCGLRAPRFTVSHFVPDGEIYDGPLQPVKRDNNAMQDGVHGVTLYLWNGEDYCELRYKNFCTQNCATAYANAAIEKEKK